MWFTRDQFAICQELKQWGLEPRFEPGDVVARGFADLGFEEFQVMPGTVLLSLTAGTTTTMPAEHQHHFFWIPSVDEAIDLLEKRGAVCGNCARANGRDWVFQVRVEGIEESFQAATVHDVVLKTLLAILKRPYVINKA